MRKRKPYEECGGKTSSFESDCGESERGLSFFFLIYLLQKNLISTEHPERARFWFLPSLGMTGIAV